MTLRSKDDMCRMLDDLVEHNYYAEDYELIWRVRSVAERMTGHDRALLADVVRERLAERPSVVDILLCGAIGDPVCVPALADLLNRQERADLSTRCLIGVLGDYGDARGFGAVERFLDSDQEQSALMSMGRMDFSRALFYVLRAAKKEHMLDACLAVLQQRRKQVGLAGLIDDLRRYRSIRKRPMNGELKRILLHKTGHHSPFSKEACAAILEALT